ncbi:MAG: diaminopimelate epimerase, partial [Chloroflexota bacterium]|nr:diaminopimelate epimerase [Chloroflexota bacterium]
MRFEKWHGCGNDFILVERAELGGELDPGRVRALCDRRTGIGADGILVIGDPSARRWPLEIHNADGSVAESCGNGSRCVAAYILERHGGESCELATAGGVVRARRVGHEIGVDLVVPRVGDRLAVGPAHEAVPVDAGNPHLVIFVDDPAAVALAALADLARTAAGDANVEAGRVRVPAFGRQEHRRHRPNDARHRGEHGRDRR